jgi:5-methyltetrahydrofolate--homocysteine methyltransferase
VPYNDIGIQSAAQLAGYLQRGGGGPYDRRWPETPEQRAVELAYRWAAFTGEAYSEADIKRQVLICYENVGTAIGVAKARDNAEMLADIVQNNSLQAKGVIGIWPAQRLGSDDVEVHDNDQKIRLHFLRQQTLKADGQPNYCLSDFIAADQPDHMGAFAVSIHGIEPHIARYEAEHDDYRKIMLQALADRLAEAFAECLHQKVRREIWAYAPDEQLTSDDLIREKYRGIRPAPGYPACPDHTEKETLFKLLNARSVAGIQLTESLAMYPASSVCGWYFAHPDSKYFGLGKITDEQVQDYAARKNKPIDEMRKWLNPVLA